MPLLTQHEDPSLQQEFVNVYQELRTAKRTVRANDGASPGVQENVAMPFFVRQINFAKTAAMKGAYHYEEWPIAVIGGPYILQSLTLKVYQHVHVSTSWLVNPSFRLKQEAPKKRWDIQTWGDFYDQTSLTFARWTWDSISLVTYDGWDNPMNTPDGDVLTLEFGSRVMDAAPSDSVWKYKAMIFGHYMLHDGVYFAEGERI